jgi:transcriptional regulator with XRE-family HTH domain
MAHHPFKKLRYKMTAEQSAQAKSRAKEMLAEMLLAEIRQAVGLTQEEVAATLGIKQPTLSRLESQHDMQVSTLQRLVQALGGELEVLVHLPAGTIRVRQFDDAA